MFLFSKTPRNDHLQARGGFTLVELLIVILIMALLAFMAVSVIAGATRRAKESRTKTQIARINEYLQYRWEEYEVRVLPFRLPPTVTNREVIIAARNDALLEMIRAEMPYDRDYVDLGGGVFPSTEFTTHYTSKGLAVVPTQLAARRPSVFQRYVGTHAATWTDQNEQAECLYMILQSIIILDQSGIDHLQNDEVGDTDNDGMLEVLDAFGEPLQFVIRYDWNNDGRFDPNENISFDTLLSDALPGEAGTQAFYDGVIDFSRMRFIVRSTRLDDTATEEDAL